jgi:hypothetical protein
MSTTNLSSIVLATCMLVPVNRAFADRITLFTVATADANCIDGDHLINDKDSNLDPTAFASCAGTVSNDQGRGSDSSGVGAADRFLYGTSNSTFTRTAASGNEHGTYSVAESDFTSLWLVKGFEAGDKVLFPFELTGKKKVDGLAGASALASIDITPLGTLDMGPCTLIAQGKCSYMVTMGNVDVVKAIGSLTLATAALADVGTTASANADFSHTAKIDPLKFFDADGHQIYTITVTDYLGHPLPTEPPPNIQPVPEPGTWFLLSSGCALLAGRARVYKMVSKRLRKVRTLIHPDA